MSSSRRQSNGRSPLVNQQRQITSFFSKSTYSPSPSPSPILSKQNPNPNPKKLKSISNSSPNPSPNSSPSPATPSPLQSNPKKPLLLIGASSPSPSPSPVTPSESKSNSKSHGEDVVGRRIKVYWPLDESWYEGLVKFFDKDANKHLVQYDDAEEELLDLGKEKIELVQESVKKFKRLRRRVLNVVDEDEDEKDEVENVDDSGDEDWGKKNVEEEMGEDGEEEYMDLEDEEDGVVEGSKGKKKRGEPRKRKASEGAKLLGSGKKSKSVGGDVGNGGFKVSLVEAASKAASK